MLAEDECGIFCLQFPSDMAPKEEKGKQFLAIKDASDAIPWPDLPQQLLYIIGREKHLIRNISWGGVSKSWRAVSKKCSPNGKAPWHQLISCSNDNSGDHYHGKPQPHILSIPFLPGCYYWMSKKRRPEPWRRFQGCSHGLITIATGMPNNYSLYDPFWSWWGIPTWDSKIPFKFATLSSCPRDPNYGCSIMVLTGISRPAFVISRLGSSAAWIHHDCTLVDPYASEEQSIILTSAIGFKGKFYALSLQGALAIVEEVDSQFKITAFGKNRAGPSVLSRHFIEYLIESNGEILLAFLICRNTQNTIDDVEVFRLDLARLSWVKMESLGDRTLFLGTNSCMSVNAGQVGCKVNCVYFTHHAINGWKEFDMGTGNIQPSCNNMGSEIESPAWDEPISVELLQKQISRKNYLTSPYWF